jgi:hypothetical protein
MDLPIPDFRKPGQPMTAVPIKLPPATLGDLQAQADRLGCSRGALARALLVRGLAELQATGRERNESSHPQP